MRLFLSENRTIEIPSCRTKESHCSVAKHSLWEGLEGPKKVAFHSPKGFGLGYRNASIRDQSCNPDPASIGTMTQGLYPRPGLYA